MQSTIVGWEEEEKKLESTDHCMLPVFSILFWDSELSMMFGGFDENFKVEELLFPVHNLLSPI